MFYPMKNNSIYLLFFSITFSQIKLDVNTIPTEVAVYLDDVNLGISPIRNERIIPGIHKFEIRKKGYAPIEYELIINPSQAVEIDFFLNPVYNCKFKTKEKGLIFELNGEHYWDVNLVRLELEAGDHILRVFKTRSLVDEQTIRVDKSQTFNYILNKPLSENDS